MESVYTYWKESVYATNTLVLRSYTDTMKSRAARVEEQNAFALLSVRHPRNGSLFD